MGGRANDHSFEGLLKGVRTDVDILLRRRTPPVVPTFGTTAERDAYWGIPTTDAERVALANQRPVWYDIATRRTLSYFAVTGTPGLTVPGLPVFSTAGWYGADILRSPIQGRIPSHVTLGGGSAAVAEDGTITFTGVTGYLAINDVFDGINAQNGDEYDVTGSIYCSADPGGAFYIRLREAGGDLSTGYFQHAMYSISTGWAGLGVTGSAANNVSAWYIGFRQYNSFKITLRNMKGTVRAKEMLGHFGSLGTNEINVETMGWTSVSTGGQRSGLLFFPNAAVSFNGWIKVVKRA